MRASLATLAAFAALAGAAASLAFVAPSLAPARETRLSAARGACRARLPALQMKSDRGDGKVNRRVVLALATLPLLGLRKAEAMTDAEEIVKLQAEAARIQEIFDVQKAASANLPSLKDSLKVAKSAAPNEEQVAKGPLKSEDPAATDMKDVQKVVAKLMTSLQTEGEKGMVVVLDNSAPNNPLKSMEYEKVCNFMRETKLAVLLGHFEKFQILPPKDLGQDAEGRALKRVDVLVKAPYQTMLQWGMQFDDMIMGNEKDLLCTSTFTWKMRQEADGKWLNMGCRVIDPIQA